jgi:hypothetical protein
MNKKCCTLILQRNLPHVTNEVGDFILENSGELTDFYVIESGSDDDKLSKFVDTTFHGNWPDARKNGLRPPRGFNYALCELDRLGLKYDYYFMLQGDVDIKNKNTLEVLISEMEAYPKIGMISPMSKNWGNEFKDMYSVKKTRPCTLIPHLAWLVSRELIDSISKDYKKDMYGYIYDGTNFRGYDTDTEILVKCYQNDMFPAITSKVYVEEKVNQTNENHEVMKTEKTKDHQKLFYEEGMVWLKKKYGFDGKIPMRKLLDKSCSDFFNNNPEIIKLFYKR